ncbi:MAG: penicillin-binding protein 2 [Bacteroidaceae bacterium]|nr:penicillin-binding protein 2 [Bacteroidaceae bacterium]
MSDPKYEYRKFVIGGIVLLIVITYSIRLAYLQLMCEDYKVFADSNAFLNNVIFPARGVIYDRNGDLLVYNQPAYDIMVVMREVENLDTLDFCSTLDITKDEFIQRMNNIKDCSKNPGYSSYTHQIFMGQIRSREFSVFQEKLFRFKGFYLRERNVRRYTYPNAAHLLGDVAEVSPRDIERDGYYDPGDYIGKQGVESSYETDLRGVKGVQVLLRDAHGRIQGHYKNGAYDRKPVPGRNITLSIDMELQRLGERLMEGKMGAIVAIEPSTGEILAMVSAPNYDPRLMEGKERSRRLTEMFKDPMRPMLNRAISGTYPPGSTFKTSQGLTFLQEGIITDKTIYPCAHGFRYGRLKVGCHSHPSPIPLIPAIATSCNGYFCWGLYYMLGNRKKYPTVQQAMTTWKDYMVSMGFGYRLGIDMPGEARGMIPNANFYDKVYRQNWSALNIISISIGQGEVTLTPLQIANLGATIANRGYYITPHVVKHVEGGNLADSLLYKHVVPVDKRYYEMVVNGMRGAVIGGTCRGANNPWYEVCGKTGTAQNRGHDHSVFMGFAPRNNPKIAIAVYVENGGWGATYGVPIGALMMEQYIRGELSEASKQRALSIQGRHIIYN